MTTLRKENPMNNMRAKIIEALKKEPMTLSDLAGACKSATRKQIVDATNHAAKDGLLTKGRCDVTNEPLYTLTNKGRCWTPAKPGANLRKPRDTMAGHPQPPKPDETPVEAGGDEKQETIAPEQVVDAIRAETDAALAQIHAICSEAGVPEAPVVDRVRTLAQRLQDRYSGAEYTLVFPGETHPTPDAAINSLMVCHDRDVIEQAVVVAIKPIGKIAIKPVLVPMVEAA